LHWLSLKSSLTRAAVITAAIFNPIEVSVASEVSGAAVDGDTLSIGSQEVRVHGIDAPETSQRCQLPKGTWDCSGAAISALASMIEGKAVRCVGHEIDQYGRLIAKCSTIGVPDIGAVLVARGLAWAFIKFSSDYANLEIPARTRRVGIWQSKTQPP
jgi:endonuclease YncB( thermonuclease family)